MPISREDLRLTAAEMDELLTTERTVRAATISADGWPHIAPLWFVWEGGAVWVNSLTKSRRMRNILAGSPVALCADTGTDYQDLRGVVLFGRFEVAGTDPGLVNAKEAFSTKYFQGRGLPRVKSHVWLKFTPERVISWDFRKIPEDRDPQLRLYRKS